MENKRVLIPCDSIYGPAALVLEVDPTPGKRLRRILSVDVLCPTLNAVAELTEATTEFFGPAKSMRQAEAAHERFNEAIGEMAKFGKK